MIEKMDRPKFKEIRYGDSIPEEYDLVQLKMDGMWGCMTIVDGEYTITSRTGKVKATGSIEWYSPEKTVILGEYMKNSHWAHKYGCDGYFYAFDCLMYKGQDISHETLAERLYTLTNYVLWDNNFGFVYPLNTFYVDEWETVWKDYVEDRNYEGLVFKNSSSMYSDKNAWCRMKGEVEIEYICHDFRPADEGTKYEGQVGAVIGTLADKEVFVTCGGLTDEQRELYTIHKSEFIGKVFTAKGNAWYPSGSIRHPKFKGWRDDKLPEECTYDQIPETLRCTIDDSVVIDGKYSLS